MFAANFQFLNGLHYILNIKKQDHCMNVMRCLSLYNLCSFCWTNQLMKSCGIFWKLFEAYLRCFFLPFKAYLELYASLCQETIFWNSMIQNQVTGCASYAQIKVFKENLLFFLFDICVQFGKSLVKIGRILYRSIDHL